MDVVALCEVLGVRSGRLTFAAVLVVGSDPAPVVDKRSVVQEEGGGACDR